MTIFPAHIRPDGTIQTCERHCKNVATASEAFLASVGLRDTGYLGGVLHDCGKFTDEFRTYIEKASRGEKVERGSVIHTFAAVRLLLEKYHDRSGPYEVASELLACAVGAHHGLFDCFDEENKSGLEHRLKKQPEYDQKAIFNFFGNCIDESRVDALFESASTEIGRCAMRCKAISSGNDELYFYLSMMVRLVTSAIVDADRQDTAGFMNQTEDNKDIEGGQYPWSSCLKTLYDYLDALPQAKEIQRARRAFSDVCDQRAELPPRHLQIQPPNRRGQNTIGASVRLKARRNTSKKAHFLYITATEYSGSECGSHPKSHRTR